MARFGASARASERRAFALVARRSSENKKPQLVFLENAIVAQVIGIACEDATCIPWLACLDLGYLVEWRVVNAADYGFPQRRRRVFLIAHRVGEEPEPDWQGPMSWSGSFLVACFPSSRRPDRKDDAPDLKLEGDLLSSREIRGWQLPHPVLVGRLKRRKVWTRAVVAHYSGPETNLATILQGHSSAIVVFHPGRAARTMGRPEGPEGIPRIAKNGHEYLYSEGGTVSR